MGAGSIRLDASLIGEVEMTIKSINELLAQANSTIPDNTAGLVDPVDVRQMFLDLLDTVSPAYGVISLASQAVALNTSAPVRIAPFSTVAGVTAGLFDANLTNGTVTRTLNGVAGSTVQIIASGQVVGSNNSDITIRLFKNGVATPFVATVNAFGANNPAGFNIAGLDYADVDATYDLRALAPNGTYTFSNIVFLLQAQPVRSFV